MGLSPSYKTKLATIDPNLNLQSLHSSPVISLLRRLGVLSASAQQWGKEQGASVRGGTRPTHSACGVAAAAFISRRADARLVLFPLPAKEHCEGDPKEDDWDRSYEVPPQRTSQIQERLQRRDRSSSEEEGSSSSCLRLRRLVLGLDVLMWGTTLCSLISCFQLLEKIQFWEPRLEAGYSNFTFRLC
ncbi:zinc-binding ribosomal protein family protein [Actinidia rufa]|uniref:Zinc-binding ribosomal protein family protein n=1 Tax=Actinidia rufa TaxID=165716 RepID=A0A7J0G090_9ERIC|nr:zinc-binding ribosomal protein family protein [Actinidia rufa]